MKSAIVPKESALVHSGKMGVNYLALWQRNNASKKIWEFVVPEIFRILVNEPSKLAQKMPFCVSQTLLSSF